MVQLIFIYWFKRQASKSAKIILSPHFSRKEIEDILSKYWDRYLSLKKDVLYQPTLGGRTMVHLAAMSTAFYNELEYRGFDEKTITDWFYQIAWKVYVKMGKMSWSIAGLFGKRKKLKKSISLFRKFPFNNPSYKWIDHINNEKEISFDCVKCPVAEYFGRHELSNFCSNTWCAFDFPLAELWGAKLERKGSIAGGATKCDFKWIAKNV